MLCVVEAVVVMVLDGGDDCTGRVVDAGRGSSGGGINVSAVMTAFEPFGHVISVPTGNL